MYILYRKFHVATKKQGKNSSCFNHDPELKAREMYMYALICTGGVKPPTCPLLLGYPSTMFPSIIKSPDKTLNTHSVLPVLSEERAPMTLSSVKPPHFLSTFLGRTLDTKREQGNVIKCLTAMPVGLLGNQQLLPNEKVPTIATDVVRVPR